jgi:hypothetical protein
MGPRGCARSSRARQGVSNLGNPEDGRVLASPPPQFAPRAGDAVGAAPSFGIAFRALTLAWLALYATAVAARAASAEGSDAADEAIAGLR